MRVEAGIEFRVHDRNVEVVVDVFLFAREALCGGGELDIRIGLLCPDEFQIACGFFFF